MRLVASVICRNELSRYLTLAISHLLKYCDDVVVLDDGSTDGTSEWLSRQPVIHHRLDTDRDTGGDFLSHADKRNRLLQLALQESPDYVLAIDADEFATDGQALRRACEGGLPSLNLIMREVWQVWDDCLCIREDGGWRSHDVAMLWSPTIAPASTLQICDRGPATGRTPTMLDQIRSYPTDVSVLHFGWANTRERRDRFMRYAQHDGGRYHAGAHLASIMWPDERVRLGSFDWTPELEPYRGGIMEVAAADLSSGTVRDRFCVRHLATARA